MTSNKDDDDVLCVCTEKATSKLLLDPDWESTLQICDNIRQGDVQ